ncbi:MAG: ParA family protein [Planctomycetes bacterium]|nr:ParA family protein [Planctomycetota bacterium]
MRSIVLANQKGGVGKTTTAIHLAHGFALAGRRVLLMDLDPQGNATVAVQGMRSDSQAEPPHEWMTAVAERLWLVPSAGGEAVQSGEAQLDTERLNEVVKSLDGEVDVLVVDCPPRMDEWGWAGVQLCEEVLVPVQAEFFSMHGLSQMMAFLEEASKRFPGKGKLRGVLPTMVDTKEEVAQEILDDLRANLGDLLLQSVIFRDSSLVEAASHGQSVFVHSPWSKGALCYTELVQEIIDG